MARSMRDTILKERNMVKGHTSGEMDLSMQENGWIIK